MAIHLQREIEKIKKLKERFLNFKKKIKNYEDEELLKLKKFKKIYKKNMSMKIRKWELNTNY